ncbi:MAG: peptide chain release factor N(5)-glutamine methyltransferase [Candidatus Moranbacteria bacterium]|nr:peptide chain release factor N(5)-glutamine methyltransferase [Candidatus Moranbacteria bacterium]
MATISDTFNQYFNQLDRLDLELLIAHTLKKPREFVISHPDYTMTKKQETITKHLISRRLKHEPMAYILGQKEFYGLNFKVNKNTLIPRPETEILVESVISNLQLVIGENKKYTTIIDLGTGSGNIIISIAKEIIKSKLPITNYQLLASDISAKALRVAKQNARLNKVDKKIKFLKSDLLNVFLKNKECSVLCAPCSVIITANLPYLSKKIYKSTMPDVKNYEPKSALLSSTDGLKHYKKLLEQIKKIQNKCSMFHVMCYLEISPEQKPKIQKIIKSILPKSKITFHKDLAKRWRVCQIEL